MICKFKNINCQHAGLHKDKIYCGLMKGGLFQTLIDNIVKCPKDKKKGKHEK
jgi:hypothetical protein